MSDSASDPEASPQSVSDDDDAIEVSPRPLSEDTPLQQDEEEEQPDDPASGEQMGDHISQTVISLHAERAGSDGEAEGELVVGSDAESDARPGRGQPSSRRSGRTRDKQSPLPLPPQGSDAKYTSDNDDVEIILSPPPTRQEKKKKNKNKQNQPASTDTAIIQVPASDSQSAASSFFHTHMLRPLRDMGNVSTLPTDLTKLLPILSAHFNILHTSWKNCDQSGLLTLWYAMPPDHVEEDGRNHFVKVGKAHTTNPPRFYGHVGNMTHTTSCKRNDSWREHIVSINNKYGGNDDECQAARDEVIAKWQNAKRPTLRLDFSNIPQLLSNSNAEETDNPVEPSIELLYLACCAHTPPLNLVLVTQDMEVVYKHRQHEQKQQPTSDSPDQSPTTAAATEELSVVGSMSEMRARVVTVSPDGELEHLETVVIHQFNASLRPHASCADEVKDGDADEQRLDSTTYWLMVGKDGATTFGRLNDAFLLLHSLCGHPAAHPISDSYFRDRAEEEQEHELQAVHNRQDVVTLLHLDTSPPPKKQPSKRKSGSVPAGRTKRTSSSSNSKRKAKTPVENGGATAEKKQHTGEEAEAKGRISRATATTSAAGSKKPKQDKARVASETSTKPTATHSKRIKRDHVIKPAPVESDVESDGESDENDDSHPNQRYPCKHFWTCSEGGNNKNSCSTEDYKSRKAANDHEKSGHPHCCLDLYTKKCPAYVARDVGPTSSVSHTNTFKLKIMAGVTGKPWRPIAPPAPNNTELTPIDQLVVPATSDTNTKKSEDARKAHEDWIAQVRAGAASNNTPNRQEPGTPNATSPFNTGITRTTAGQPFTQSLPPTTYRPLYGPVPTQGPIPGSVSSGHTARATAQSLCEPGAAQLIPAWPFWDERPHDVHPLIFHEQVAEFFRKATSAEIVLFRPNQVMVPSLMPHHLGITNPDLTFPCTSHPDLFPYYEAPLSSIIPTPLPDVVAATEHQRTAMAEPTLRTLQRREEEFNDSVNTTLFKQRVDDGEVIVAKTYRKDNADCLWPIHSKPNQLGQPATTPTFTPAEYHQWHASQDYHERAVMSANVLHRAVVNDDRADNAMYDSNDHAELVEKRITFLKSPSMAIFDLHLDDQAKLEEAAEQKEEKKEADPGRRSKRNKQQPEGQQQQQSAAQTGQPLTIEFNNKRWVKIAELHTAHPLNHGRIAGHPNSLTSLLPIHGLDWTGGCIPLLYVKQDRSGAFSLHVEQGFMPFVNTCHHGTGIWYGISAEHNQKLIKVINDIARQHNLWDADFDLTTVHIGLAMALLYSRALMPDVRELVCRYNIPVRRWEQESGDTMIGVGFFWHMGTTGSATTITEAVNAVPVWWLTSGLPQLVIMLKTELTPYINAKMAYDKSLATAATRDNPTLPTNMTQKAAKIILSDHVTREFCRLIPVAWFRVFVRTVLYHLRAHLRSTPTAAESASTLLFRPNAPGMDFSKLSGRQLKDAEASLKQLTAWLETSAAEYADSLQQQ